MTVPSLLVALLVVSMPLAAASPEPSGARPSVLDLSLPPEALMWPQSTPLPLALPATRDPRPVDAIGSHGAALPYGYGYEARQAGQGPGRGMGRGRRR